MDSAHIVLSSSFTVAQSNLQRPLIHTFTHQWVAAGMQGAASLTGSNLGLSVLPKHTSDMDSWSWDLKRQPFNHQFASHSRSWTDFMPSKQSSFHIEKLPLVPFKKRVGAQATVSRCWFVELWPAALHQRLRLHPALLLLVTGLHQDNLETVELLNESQGFLELALALGYLQRAVQQLHRALPLDVPLSRAQGLVRIEQRHGHGLRTEKKAYYEMTSSTDPITRKVLRGKVSCCFFLWSGS